MGKFVKGQSGNPGGRRKKDHDLKALAKDSTPEAFAVLLSIMNNKTEAGSARVQAANAVLDRGWGKPQQSMDVTHRKSPLDDLDAATLSALAKALAGGQGIPAGGDEADTRH